MAGRRLLIPAKLSVVVLSAGVLSCDGGSSGRSDARPPVADSGQRDTGMAEDTGGVRDTGARDSGERDSGERDTGMSADAQRLDFGPNLFCIPDPTYDAGHPLDACSGVVNEPDECAEGCRAVG